MLWSEMRIGWALTGSFCTFEKAFLAAEEMKKTGAEILPIFSPNAFGTDTRFGTAEKMRRRMEEICGRESLHTVAEVEPIGPKKLLDVLVIAPCTGNTLAKLAAGIADTAVTMAVKSHLRNGRPVVVAVSTNDGLGRAAKNIGMLMDMKNMYFVPFGQDDWAGKPNSLVADFGKILPAVEAALEGRQIQPVLC